MNPGLLTGLASDKGAQGGPSAAGATQPVGVWIAGAGGILAGEFLRLIEHHPLLFQAGIASRREGSSAGDLHPHLYPDLHADRGVATPHTALAMDSLADELTASLAGPSDHAGPDAILLLALPHGKAATTWSALRERLGSAAERLLVVDLSADYRLQDSEGRSDWYGEHPDPAGLDAFTYGLVEWNRAAIKGTRCLAVPGCFATALQLACLPAAAAGLLGTSAPWVFNAITGSSGSGNQPSAKTHHPHRNGDLSAYALVGHRHEEELVQGLATFATIGPESTGNSPAPEIVFLPHSGPYVRGIHLTATLPLAQVEGQNPDLAAVRAAYAQAYQDAPCVDLLPDGCAPGLCSVAGSNRASIGLTLRGHSLVVFLTLDNVVKGGAGQALQGINLMLGLPETTGLSMNGLGVL